MGELAGNSSGFGLLDGEASPPKFGRSNNGDIAAIELAYSAQDAINNWNLHTSYWLKHYLYLRCERPGFLKPLVGHKLYATLVTRLTAAFWHGFYPGYFFFFGFSVLGSYAEDVCRRRVGPWFLKPTAPLHGYKPVYTLIGVVHTFVQVNYYGLAFVQLSLEKTLATWNTCYWCVHVLHVALVLLVPLVVPRHKDKEEAAKKTE